MLNLREIHKPTTIDDALRLLQQPGTVALAGGTQLIASKRRDVRAVVDLSALGLSYIRERDGAIAIGATTSLAELAESPMLRAIANGVVAQAAHRSAASVLRNQGTLAGTLITEPDGILVVALLALDARVTTSPPVPPLLSGEGGVLAQREELLKRGVLVTEVTVPMANPRASLQTVARTPRDKPIVSVCAAAQIENGVAREVRIALGGVADIAVRASAAENALEGQALNDAVIENGARLVGQGLSPRGDWRSSAEYRKEMAVVLARRAVRELARD